MLEAISRASDRMQSLIADLMDLASITEGRLALRRERVDLVEIARAAVHQVRSAPAASHRVAVVASEAATVLVDRPRVEHVARQLVENAVRYSPGRGGIEVEVRRDHRNAILRVRDEGIGIPAERQGRIFEPFYRAHAGTPHDFGGVGIGLYLARQIALAHGGDIRFESAEGVGSTFEMRLPIAGEDGS
jgi:two-component system, OmpR family, phosphate regulon sensor histidine kinase PhoR